MPFNNFAKHPNRHAGLDPVSRTQWNYWFPAFAGMTKVEFSSFLHDHEFQMRLPWVMVHQRIDKDILLCRARDKSLHGAYPDG
ncbi:MAG: hypothetical protein KJ882_01415 [Proteobacteria bacterium]|nr:hypothetical protein [Pseudomonadota bacterium]MBU4009396.1 hypothetical protein [Pseudomonadota bacterium]